MPSSWITKSDSNEVRLAHAVNRTGVPEGEQRSYDLVNDPRFQDADKTKVAAVLKAVVQADLEVVILLRDLPDDEPTKTVDPAPEFGECFFWRGHGANRELVGVDTIVEDCVWNGTAFVFTMRRARRP